MTRIHDELGSVLDTVRAAIPHLRCFAEHPERAALSAAEERARQADDAGYAEELIWESAVLDTNIESTTIEGFLKRHPYEEWAQVYQFADRTRAYLQERARESQHPLIRVRHLEFLLRTGPQKGREWAQLSRERPPPRIEP